MSEVTINDFIRRGSGWRYTEHLIPMKGASLKEVQEILGHKTISMTMRYAHLSQEHKKKAVNLLSGLTASEKPRDQNGHKLVTNEKPAVYDAGQVLDIIGRGERI